MLGVGNSFINYNRIESAISNTASIKFDGVNDYLDASTSAGSINTATGSMSIWGNLTTGSNNDSYFMTSIGTSPDNKIGVIHNTGSDIIRGFYKGGGTQINVDKSITEASLISAGWHHIVLTWDTTDKVKLYYNGVLEDEATISDNAFEGTTSNVILGKGANANNTYWAGYLDEYSLWKRVLAADEITTIYNSGTPKDLTEGHSAGLIQWLRFESTATTVPDDSGNGFTGTEQGSTSGDTDSKP